MHDLVKLNPNDNQANRYLLSTLLVVARDWNALTALLQQYDEPSAPMLAAKALMLYANNPTDPEAKATKKALMQENKHFVKYLTGQKKAKGMVTGWTYGDASEAEYYIENYGKEAWRSVEGAMGWLRKK